MTVEDINADIEMYFNQIVSLTDLMLENNAFDLPNVLTIRDLAQKGFETTLNKQ